MGGVGSQRWSSLHASCRMWRLLSSCDILTFADWAVCGRLWFTGAPRHSAARHPVCLGRVSLVTKLQGHFQSCLAPDKHSLCVHARFACLPVCLHACLFVSRCVCVCWGGGIQGWNKQHSCEVCVLGILVLVRASLYFIWYKEEQISSSFCCIFSRGTAVTPVWRPNPPLQTGEGWDWSLQSWIFSKCWKGEKHHHAF